MRTVILLISFFVVLISCRKEIGVQGPAGSQGPAGDNAVADTGTISGNLFVYNEFGFETGDFSDVTVTLIGGSSQMTVTPGSTGQYSFHGMQTGTYDLTYTKQGYGTMKIFGLSHFAGSSLPTSVKDVYLLQLPVKTAIDSIYTPAPNSPYVPIAIELDTSSLTYVQYDQNFLLFVGKDKNVSTTDNVIGYNQIIVPDGQGGYSYAFAKSDLSMFFTQGDTMYITAYTYNRFVHPTSSPIYLEALGDGSYYVDPATGLYVYPNLKIAPNVLKVVY
jgi:hypothetical protein